jgi:rhodanese-related sulfurtransferase
MPRWLAPAAAVLLVLAVTAAWIGQPAPSDRWDAIAAEQQPLIEQRDVYIAPQELLSLIGDVRLKAVLLDVRPESDYNQFHILGAQRQPPERIQATAKELLFQPANTVFVVMSNGEAAATDAWKALRAESLPNVYILEGGVNHWIDTFAAERFRRENALGQVSADQLAWRFPAATGSRHPAAEPNPYVNLDFEPKVKLEIKRAPGGGGCG